jgi:hypothetical protein
LNWLIGFIFLPFFVETGLLLACFVWLQLEMYSRKFGLRLQRKCGNLLKTADYPPRRAGSGYHGLGNDCRGLGDMRNWDEIEVLRERKFVSASSRNQQAGSLRSPER